jgi:hypothetical protein
VRLPGRLPGGGLVSHPALPDRGKLEFPIACRTGCHGQFSGVRHVSGDAHSGGNRRSMDDYSCLAFWNRYTAAIQEDATGRIAKVKSAGDPVAIRVASEQQLR